MSNDPAAASWLAAPVLGAVLAALGYIGTRIYEQWLEWSKVKRERRVKLLQLRSLLNAGKAAFDIQNELAIQLEKSLHSNQNFADGIGYDDVFAKNFGMFTNDQKELHNIVRGYSEYALFPINSATQKWLTEDTYFKGRADTLARVLSQLEAHITLWLAKYAVWLKDKPQHALVYLEDEKKHGLGFPHEVDALVKQALE